MPDHHPPSDSAPKRDIVIAGHRHDRSTISDHLDSPDPVHRKLALSAAHRAGMLDAGRLSAALDDPDESVQRRGVELAARWASDDASVVERLVALAQPNVDPDDIGPPDETVEACYFALGELARTDPPIVDVLERAALNHHDHLCREAAVAALGSLGVGRAALVAALDDRANVRRRAVLGLVHFDGPDIDAALERALGDRDWQVRQAAEDLLTPEPE